ncbi:MAG: phosphate ABC transporter permease PstA [Acidobacteriota bacterium]|nr:phosphate ABC transporter permease PstA [Acidobacteriota bacterium]
MKLQTRKVLDKSFTGMGFMSIFLLSAALIMLLAPIFARGIGAFVFRATSEFRRLDNSLHGRGSIQAVEAETRLVQDAREPVYRMLAEFEAQLDAGNVANGDELYAELDAIRNLINRLLGPRPGESVPVLMRDRFGKTRWDKARETLHHILYRETWDYSDPTKMGVQVEVPRAASFKGTALEPLFPYLENNLERMLRPRLTLYWGFLFDESHDAHFFGGIWPEMLGTLYLVFGTMLFAIPIGVIAAVYLTEFATQGKVVSLLRTFISTLAGVPSIVFGLFGLAFFINTLKISSSKSVLAGSMTLALLVLPTIIRASEEAIKAVPRTYKEASLSLGASRIHTVARVILPAALPGILTGIVISMGRAAGETAPIIFTAAVSVGKPLGLLETLNQPTPALPWNIYNLATEHEAVDEIRHVQFGMVFTLVLLVLLLNLAAIILRARVSKKLRG